MSNHKTRTTLIASAALALCALLSPAAHAQGWQFLPLFNDPQFKPEATLAITGNRLMPDQGSDANAWGIDFNMNCGLLQSPDKRIRTHVNLSRSDDNGVKVTALELSPRYTMPLSATLSVGVGPSLAVFKVDNAVNDRSLTGLGAAVGLNYRAGSFYAGADLRYHATGARSGMDLDPVTVGMKVGINF